MYGFPGAICISVNDEAVHGIPGARRLADGDIVTLDVTAELGGYMADAAVTAAEASETTDTRSFTDAVIGALPDARTDTELFEEVWR